MEPFLLIGGALLLLTATKSQATNNTASTLPGQFLINKNKSFTGAAIQMYEAPIASLDGIHSYADYAFVENALNALGYDVSEISDEAINACVYRVSVYFWYYQLQAIGQLNPNLVLTESGALGVIDEWIIFQGYSKIGGIRGNHTSERNKLVTYSKFLHQGVYIAGDAVETATEIIDFAAENQETIDSITAFLESIGIEPLGVAPGTVVREYLIDNGVDSITAFNIGGLISSDHKYWDAAVVLHIYLVNNPSILSIYTPVYI